jgi:hypothetical protein
MASMLGGTADYILGFVWKVMKWLWEKLTNAFRIVYEAMKESL